MKNIKFRLILVFFLQFFVWGAWLITMANYWFETKHWSGSEFGLVFSTLGISSVIMPALTGIIADKWINGERLYGVLHILYAGALLLLSQASNPSDFFWIMFLAMLFYMPTIALSNTLGYSILSKRGFDVVKDYPPIRVWGTVGFILAMWVTNITGNKASINQFYIASVMSFVLGLYAFTLPKCEPQNVMPSDASIWEKLGLNAFSLFKKKKMAIFFIFSMFLGASLQLTNMYGDVFLSDFGKIAEYKDSLVVRYSTVIMSISQISETLFILAIPFFLKKLGIKKVMLMSMFAWVFRFGLLAYGEPNGIGFGYIVLSCIVYGMAFDFFNISGSLFVEKSTDKKIRSSAQGLFMMMTNGFGAILGSYVSGLVIQIFFTDKNGLKMWHEIWLAFAIYALVVAVLFAICFRPKTRVDFDKK